MAEAVTMAAWDRTAWLCLHIPNFSKKRRRLSDVHPLRGAKRQVNLGKLLRQMDEFSKHLPEHMTEAEIDAAWDKWKDSDEAKALKARGK